MKIRETQLGLPRAATPQKLDEFELLYYRKKNEPDRKTVQLHVEAAKQLTPYKIHSRTR